MIDDSGNSHKITIKTKGRLARPMMHPDYPNLIKLLDIKNPDVKIPAVTPKSTSRFETIKQCHLKSLSKSLKRW